MSVRRSLVAALKGLLTPVGGATTADSTTPGDEAVWGGTVAAEAGTVTSVSARFATAGETIRFFTTRDVAGTWTVRDTTANLTSILGLNAYTVALAIQPGDSLGVYTSSGRAGLRRASGAGSYFVRTAGGVPTAGGAYANDTTDTAVYAFVGVGNQ